MIKAVFFDLDGTVLDTNELILQSFRHAFTTRLNITVPDETILTFFGEPLHYSMSKYSDDVEPLLETYREFNWKHHDSMVEPFHGTVEALKELREMGLYLGIITSKRRNVAMKGIDLFDLAKYFDVIITPEDTEEHKPKAGPLLKACELLGIEDPSTTMMVGDSTYDILCGKNANASTVAVRYSKISLDILKSVSPDFLVDSLLEIPGIVKGFRQEA